MSVTTTKTLRTMMYLGSIGGVLLFQGAIFMYVWNFLSENLEDITLLEGIGLSAISYVIMFSFKYGASDRTSASPLFRRKTNLEKKCAEMTPQQRAELRSELIEKCGCVEQRVANGE